MPSFDGTYPAEAPSGALYQPTRTQIYEWGPKGGLSPGDYQPIAQPLKVVLGNGTRTDEDTYKVPSYARLIIFEINSDVAILNPLDEYKLINHGTDTARGLGDTALTLTDRMLLKAMQVLYQVQVTDLNRAVLIDQDRARLSTIAPVLRGSPLRFRTPPIVEAGNTIKLSAEIPANVAATVLGGDTEFSINLVGVLVRVKPG